MSSRSLSSFAIGSLVLLLILSFPSITSSAQALPPLPGQHPWSHRGQGPGRSGFSPATGPQTPVLEPPEWPYDQVHGDVEADPVVGAGGTVYFGSTNGSFYALHPSAPTTEALPKWRFDAQAPIRSAAAVKPAPHGDDPSRVYFTTEDGRVHSLDLQGGEVWSQTLQASVDPRSAPALGRAPSTNRVRVYLATGSGVYALEETSVGVSPSVTVLWHEPTVQSARSVALSPDGERVYATAGGSFYVLQASPSPGTQVMDDVNLGGDLTGPVLDEDERAYVGSDDGTVYQIDAPGAIVVSSDPFGAPVSLEPALAPEDGLAVVSGDVLHLSHRDLITRAWRYTSTAQVPAWHVASEPVVDGEGTVFVAGDDVEVHAIRGGNEAWEHPISGNAYTSPALTRDGRLYVGTNDNSLRAIQSEPSFEIAFDGDLQDSSTFDVYSVHSAYGVTGSVRRLTDDPAGDGVPAYSSLGQFMAFSSDREGPDRDVFLGTAAGSNLQNVTVESPGTPFAAAESDETDPAFSPTDQRQRSLLPDSTRYLAVTTGFDFGWSIFFINMDTLLSSGSISGLSLSGFLSSQGASGAAAQVPSQHAQPAFSPDGRYLAYGGCQDTGTGPQYQLRVVDLLQDNQTIVATESTDACEAAAGFHPFFSPDSQYLAYEAGTYLYVTDDMAQPGTQVSSFSGVFEPAWSPDGAAIVYNTFLFTSFPIPQFDERLSTLSGPRYVTSTTLLGSRSSDGAYHPRRLPVPEMLIDRCAVQNNLSPTSQQPGELITIRGCGFDIRFPENNSVAFPRADGPGVVRTEAISTAVDLSTGLGVITVKVPMLAGDGQIAVNTPFGSQSLTETFHVEPLATALQMSDSIPDGYIRVMGYGFETDDVSSYGIRFSGPASALAVTPSAIRLETCSSPETPCALSQLPGGEVGWLEVQVPHNAADGSVIVERTIGGALVSSTPPDMLTLLEPQVSVSPETGSAGDVGAGIDPVVFDLEGSGFPYDPYFGYTEVDLFQVDPGPQGETSLGSAALGHLNRFVSSNLQVRPNSGGRLSMTARLPAQQTSGTLAQASAPFTTPLKDLPIVFVPGTSGTFLENTGQTFRHGTCGAFAACKVAGAIGNVTSGGLLGSVASVATTLACGAHDPNDFQAGENVWLNGHALVHILVGCSNWLDVIQLNPNDNHAPSQFSDIQIGAVMDEVQTPAGADNIDIYKSLFNFIKDDMNRTLVPYGSSCPAGESDCLYLFNQDWRLGMESEAQRLDTLISRALTETNQPRVLIVTHSYGGPTTNYYLRTVPGAPGKVDQVITLGGGHMGVVRPYKALEVGDTWEIEKFEVLRLKKKNVQEIARDWPTAYWQMPQSNWFSDPNKICPKDGSGVRDCTWVEADWDATTPIKQGPAPGELDSAASTYAFVEDSTAMNPFRGSSVNKWAPNVNAGKFQTARDELLDLSSAQNDSTLSCSQSSAAGLGDWRCGTQGVFFQRIVGFGTDTTVRVQFKDHRICLLKTNVFGARVRVCFKNRWIEPFRSTEGDSTIPLRSAVGILSHDGAFDTRDSRIWGLDGAGNSDFTMDGQDEDAKFHSSLPSIKSVHTFIQYAAEGKLTDISQISANWPNDQWPFMVPCGVPDANDAPSGTPVDGNCYTGTVQPAAAAQTAPDYWAFELMGDVPMYVTNEDGEGAGPLPELPDGSIAQLPGVDYERNPGFTRMLLPHDSGTYTVTLEGDPTDSDATQLDDLVQLQILSEGDGTFSETLHTFLSIPFTDTTEARLVWDTTSPVEEPTLEVDYAGDGEITPVGPDASLSGAAAGDTTPPESTIYVDDGVLTIEADDEGGAGIHQIVYGTDRAHANGELYTGPVELPPDTTYVWAFATDRAGNTELQDAVYATCELPTDFDGDGQVRTADLDQVASVWTSDRLLSYDLNGNDGVDVGDIQVTAATLGDACGAPAALDGGGAGQSEGLLRVESPPTVSVGAVFTVEVGVEGPDDLAGFDTTLAYNPFMFALQDVELAGTLEETGRSTGLLGPMQGSTLPDGSQAIRFGGFSYGEGAGLDSGGALVRLTFQAVAAGEGTLRVTDGRLADTEGALTTPSSEGQTITVEPFRVFVPLVLRDQATGAGR